jgi:hypothetical protein
MKHIVTHAGQAHRDDFISVALILAIFQNVIKVFRRDPTAEELADPEVCVVDVGGNLNPELNNFDHHQERDLDCALVQVLKGMKLYESALATFKWLGFTNDLDTKGPFVVAKNLGINPDMMFGMLSPIEEQILFMFGQESEVCPNMILLMREIGKGLLEKIQFTETRMGELELMASTVEVDGLIGIISPIEDRPSSLLQEYREKHVPTAAFSICPDDRGEGWIMYRYNDNPRLNFSKIEGKSGILFAHKGGFIAKTAERIGQEEVLAFVSQAVV